MPSPTGSPNTARLLTEVGQNGTPRTDRVARLEKLVVALTIRLVKLERAVFEPGVDRDS